MLLRYIRKHANYVVAICIPLVAFAIQSLLWSFISPFVWFLFYPAVFFSARVGGFKTGIIGTILSVLIVWYFFLPPVYSFELVNQNNIFSLVVFVIMGFLISDLQERLKKANIRTLEALNEARLTQIRVQQLYEKSVETEKLKTHFFTSVSHELRTPLTLIINPISDLLKHVDLTSNDHHILKTVERNARLLHRQVTDLLDISKLEANQMVLNYSRINLVEYTRLITSYFESAAENNQLKYTVILPEMLIAEVDASKYQRIIQNLISNAFKFTPANGEIKITLSSNDETFVLEVEDTGPGIPNEIRSRIFERFQQIDREGEDAYGGTGLGLAIVKEFVELHLGQVSILDTPHGGALFQLVIPLKAPIGKDVKDQIGEELFSVDQNLSADLFGGISKIANSDIKITNHMSTILIVDDNSDIADYITRILSSDFLVLIASNGKEGVEKALLVKPDLIISDIMMPIMSGEEMVLEIRKHPALADIPIIMLSAVFDEEVKNRLLKESVQDFINKPFSSDELRYKVLNIIKQSAKQHDALVDVENRYKYALENMLEGCQILNHNWEYIYINPSAEKQNKVKRELLLGQSFTQMWPGIENTDVYKHIKNCMDNRVSNNVYNEFIFPDGSIGWFELSIHPVPEGVFILSIDVTARKNAEEKSLKTEADLKKAQKIAALGYWTLSVKDYMLEFSEEMYTIFGIDKEHFTGNLDDVVNDIIHPEDRDKVNYTIMSLLEKGESTPVEYRVVWKDGSVHYVRTEASELFLDDQKKPYMVKGIVQDITQRKFAEQEIIRAKNRAEESDRFKTAFLANMSHEIRTPMNAIVGFSNLLVNRDLEPGKRETFTKMIQQRSFDLLHIIDDILDVSKIEVGQMVVNFDLVNISKLLNELFVFYQEHLKVNLEKSNVVLKLNIPEILREIKISTDPFRLKQVLSNLIDNAIKFTEEGVIEFGIINKSNTEITFYVKDSGIGIEPNKQTLIFDRFRQADEMHAHNNYGGSGLGLSIVKGILELLNCTIKLDSEYGKGSTFYFDYPLDKDELKLEPDSSINVNAKKWTNKTILIVEDDKANALFLIELLRDTDVKLLFAFNGKQALEVFKLNSEIALVLMDIRLPDISGLELTRHMKSQKPHLKIIAQSAYSSRSDVSACYEAGCDSYVSKPINISQLLDIIDRNLSDR